MLALATAGSPEKVACAAASTSNLAGSFLAVDEVAFGPQAATAAQGRFDALAERAAPCANGAPDPAARLKCVLDVIFGSGGITAADEPSTPQQSSLSGVLAERKGSFVGLAAVAVALADRTGVTADVVVFPHHVALSVPERGGFFELLDAGAFKTPAQMRTRLGAEFGKSIRVSGKTYLPYYTENLAVRVADDADSVRAEKLFRLAIRADDRNARVRFDFGTFLLNDSRLPEAIEQLRKAVDLDFRNPDAWANLGVAQVNSGDDRHARESFEHALRLDPTHAVARQNLAAIGGR